MLLHIDKVSKTYRTRLGAEVRAVDTMDLSVVAGEFVAVHGASGSGKTTLLLMAGGLLVPDAGAVRVAGQDLYSLTANERARFRAAHIGFVFQQFHLIPYLSVLDNVLAPALASGLSDMETRARELIERFGLSGRSSHRPSELSTGERQRTALARALLNRPKLLLADEPTGNLDPDNSERVLSCLSAFAESGGAVLLVTHEERALGRVSRLIGLAGAKSNTEERKTSSRM